MKSHFKLDDCFRYAGLDLATHVSRRAAFEAGWYACARQINEGVDSDMLQDQLKRNGFLPSASHDESIEP